MDDRENAIPHSMRDQPDEGFARPGLYLPDPKPAPILWLLVGFFALALWAGLLVFGPVIFRAVYQHFNG